MQKKIAVFNSLYPTSIGYEKTSGNSETIPDQSLTVRQILDRFTRGLGVPGGKVPYYYGEDVEHPNFDRMDISERYEWFRSSKEFVDDTYKKANTEPVSQTTETIIEKQTS